MSGTLYLVGTGPGDPELLTLKAVRILGHVDVVAYPQKTGEESFSYRIAKTHVNAAAEKLPIDIPMSVDRVPAQNAYDALAIQLKERLQAGKKIAYLCEGDPLYYGSAMYLIERIEAEFEIQVVPGITSLTASAAAIKRPIAARNDVLKILPAPLDDERLLAELGKAEAVAIMKVGRHFDRIRSLLERSGHADAAMVIERASGADQRITPLREFDQETRPYFSTILCYAGKEAWSK